MQILNLNVKYWQCHQHPQTHQYDMMLLNLQNADCSPPHGLTSTTAACRVDQHLSKYFINSDPSIDGDNSIHQEWRSHRHFLGTSTETNLVIIMLMMIIIMFTMIFIMALMIRLKSQSIL